MQPGGPDDAEDRGREVARPDADLDAHRVLRQAAKEASALLSVASLAQAVPQPGHRRSLTCRPRPDLMGIIYTFVT